MVVNDAGKLGAEAPSQRQRSRRPRHVTTPRPIRTSGWCGTHLGPLGLPVGVALTSAHSDSRLMLAKNLRTGGLPPGRSRSAALTCSRVSAKGGLPGKQRPASGSGGKAVK